MSFVLITVMNGPILHFLELSAGDRAQVRNTFIFKHSESVSEKLANIIEVLYAGVPRG